MAGSMAASERQLEIVLVDDHAVVRSGLKALIESAEDMKVVGEAETGRGGVKETMRLTPDAVVMDLRLPDMSGIEACHEIVGHAPDVHVLILTSYADRAAVRAAAAAGASGYLLKRVSAFDLLDTIRRIASGEEAFVTDHGVMDAEEAEEETDPLLTRLSPQERVIALHIAAGLTNREIAEQMFLAEKTVKNYVSHLLTKMGFSRRSEAAAYVARLEAESGRWSTASTV
jgi:two-component system response regulator DevR